MSLHDKHRQRLDKKVKEYGLEMLEPHEQLEHLLFAVIPRGDTNELAHRLLKRFVTVRGVLNADPEELQEIKGVGSRAAMFLTSLPALLGIVERNMKNELPPRMRTTKEIVDYVKTYFYGRLTEASYIFSLNSSHRLLSVSRISEGIAGE
ncbi:MAG: DNA repair protein RadC, partial [Clostridia bacterium]|nr:DNA repair protein RadC [Clostridia bacterium]